MLDTKTILIVDDEAAIRLLFCESLRRYGYHVLEACSGPDALAVNNGYSKPIDVLVSDVMMPGMTGFELAHEICAARPQLKVILISGYSELPADLERGWAFLQKPFAPSKLCAMLEEL